MRLKLTFKPVSDYIALPIHYNHMVQAFIYSSLEQDIANWLHEKGVEYGPEKFELFTFSWIFGKKRIESGRFIFYDRFWFFISSPVEQMLESFVKKVFHKSKIEFGGQECVLESVKVEPARELKSPLVIRMISPITVCSTFEKYGMKKTYYYSPFEKDFERLIFENLKKKVEAFYGRGDYPELKDAHLQPVDVKDEDFHIVKFKGFVIKGWSGIYKLELPEPYLSIAYYAGIGSKNSQGFGMWDVLKALKK